MNPSPEDIRIGRMAALEDLMATAENDSHEFLREDLTPEQNKIMQEELARLWLDLSKRRATMLLCRQTLKIGELCAACGAVAEGNFSIHRDGFEVGPEVPLCDACGGEVTPTMPDLWERIRARLVDYWCHDCQDRFRSEQTPVHAPATECPKCQGKNTYEAATE